jgi:hypothetical protein
MTRKHYEAIAQVLADARTPFNPGANQVRESIVEALARIMASDNPRFNRERFLRAAHAWYEVPARASV